MISLIRYRIYYWLPHISDAAFLFRCILLYGCRTRSFPAFQPHGWMPRFPVGYCNRQFSVPALQRRIPNTRGRLPYRNRYASMCYRVYSQARQSRSRLGTIHQTGLSYQCAAFFQYDGKISEPVLAVSDELPVYPFAHVLLVKPCSQAYMTSGFPIMARSASISLRVILRISSRSVSMTTSDAE